jgi:mutator protein MutT
MIKSAVALIFHPESKDFPMDIILGVSRKYDHNDFGLPGGKLEGDESFEECLDREILEETGLTVISKKEIFERNTSYKENVVQAKCFLCEVTGNIQTDEPHKVEWISWDTLFEGSFGEYNYKLFEHLNNQ